MAKKLPKETRIEIAKAFKRIRPEVNTDDEAYAIMKVHFPNVGRTSFHKFKSFPIPKENTVIKGKDFNLEFDCDLVKEIERLGKRNDSQQIRNQIEDFELDDEVFESTIDNQSAVNPSGVTGFVGKEPFNLSEKVVSFPESKPFLKQESEPIQETSSEIKQEPQVKASPFETLATFAKSELEKQVVLTYDKVGQDLHLAAQSLGLSFKQTENAFYRVKSRAALQGFAPEYDLSRIIPDTHYLKGASTLYRDGVPVLQWVKSDKKAEVLAKQAKELAEALAEDLPQVVIPESKHNFTTDIMVAIPFGDPHIGLHSWAEETGSDFDLKIAEKDLCGAVDRLVNSTPPSAECLIANLGDFFHADNMDAQTWRSKHALDVDSRWAKVLRVGIKAMRYCIESAAKRHQKVTVINAIGNHDDHSSMFLTVALAHIYENDKRINIIDTPTSVHYYRFGKVLIAVTHGHNIKMENLPLVVATEKPQEWGETVYRYGLTGHIHHKQKIAKDFNGMTVEAFRTLAARDAWAASKGYNSMRDMQAIAYHKDFGEVERHIVNIDMLRSVQ